MGRAERLEAEDQLPKLRDDLWFPHHTQEHSFACGPACVRMIAEWLTGKCWKEKDVADRIGWRGHFRPNPSQKQRTTAFLRRIGGEVDWRFCYRGGDEPDVTAEAELRDALDVDAGVMSIAMVHIAAYRCNARLAQTRQIPVNFGHWIIARGIRRVSADMDSEVRARPPKSGRTVDLAVVDDPAYTEARFEPWASISAQVIDTALLVRRRRKPRR